MPPRTVLWMTYLLGTYFSWISVFLLNTILNLSHDARGIALESHSTAMEHIF